MTARVWLVVPLAGAFLGAYLNSEACCPAPPPGQKVLNADQSVILIWYAENNTQHFIRQASFKSEADDFGFLVPSPSQPQLEESGNEAFDHLGTLTAPERETLVWPGGIGCGCGYCSAP